MHDHPAISAAAADHDHVVPLFVVDERLTTSGRFPSGPRNAFLRGCLADVDASLRARGAALVVRHGRPEDVVPDLARELGAAEVLWTSAVSPFARRRDRAVTDALDGSRDRGAPAARRVLRRRLGSANRRRASR